MWCSVRAMRRPSGMIAASFEFPQEIFCRAGGDAMLDWTQDDTLEEAPRS